MPEDSLIINGVLYKSKHADVVVTPDLVHGLSRVLAELHKDGRLSNQLTCAALARKALRGADANASLEGVASLFGIDPTTYDGRSLLPRGSYTRETREPTRATIMGDIRPRKYR